jgi:putative glycerol-1-phosphate prenyltransferase
MGKNICFAIFLFFALNILIIFNKSLSSSQKADQKTSINVDDLEFLKNKIEVLKEKTQLPILIFPGNPSQISDEADGILFLSLLSGRNPDYLIEHQINSVRILEQTNLEIIPTAYLLIEGGKETAVQKISQTNPIAQSNIELAYKTAKAGELLGMKLIYLEAGSGAHQNVSLEMIEYIAENCKIPVIVGGGIRAVQTIQQVYDSGADLVVIGTAFENDSNFFNE